MPKPIAPNLDALRRTIARMEGDGVRQTGVLPFGIPEIDRRLPQRGLALGSLHEVAGGGEGALDAAAPACFVAGIAARTKGHVLWCLPKADAFPPGLQQAGLKADRVIYVETREDIEVLAAMEEGLRHGGLGAVIGEVAQLTMTASRRLHLAAKGTGTIGFALRRWRRFPDAADFGMPTASMTRWRVSSVPSAPLPVPGVDRARCLLELIRARAGDSFDIEVDACDGDGRMAMPNLHTAYDDDVARIGKMR